MATGIIARAGGVVLPNAKRPTSASATVSFGLCKTPVRIVSKRTGELTNVTTSGTLFGVPRLVSGSTLFVEPNLHD